MHECVWGNLCSNWNPQIVCALFEDMLCVLWSTYVQFICVLCFRVEECVLTCLCVVFQGAGMCANMSLCCVFQGAGMADAPGSYKCPHCFAQITDENQFLEHLRHHEMAGQYLPT